MGDLRLAAESIALAVSGGELWRVQLDSGEWEKVSLGDATEGQWLGNYYGISHDGDYALSFHDGRIWRVPTAMGGQAEPLFELGVETVGSGSPVPAPFHLAGTPYWLLALPLVPGEGTGPAGAAGFIVDLDARRPLTADDFGLAASYRPTAYSASPDGRWLAVALWDREAEEAAALYVSPTSDLKAGRVMEGVAFAGWHVEAPALVLRDAAHDTLLLARLPLADGAEPLALEGAGRLLTTAPGALFAASAESPAHLLHFGLDGSVRGTLDLSARYDALLLATAAGERLYLGAVKEEPQGCTYDIVEWTPAR